MNSGRNAMNADRDLFFGVLAWQLGFVRREAVFAAARRVAAQQGRSLADELRTSGELTAARQALLEAILAEHVPAHGDDAARALTALTVVGPMRAELEEILCPRRDATLAFDLPTLPREATDDEALPPLSYGVPTSAGRRFRILRPHAKGGLGEVFVARDEELKRDVALKQVQPRHADAPENRARFLVEAEITGGLEHPGVVPVYGLGTDVDGRPFYAMRFIRGVSLKDAVDQYHRSETVGSDAGERTLQLRQLLRRMIDVCNTVEYAHCRGILHRDLKPDNIMLGTYGETLVVDWGLAKPIGQAESSPPRLAEEGVLVPFSAGSTSPTEMGSAVGTPAFMSPEQAAGLVDRLDRTSDVYSLGATLYYLLTGRPPVDDLNPPQVLDRVKRGDFPRPRDVKKSVPGALEAVALKAMALEPGARYGSARELADDLERWLADEPVRAYRAPRSERLARWARRHRRSVQTAAAALGLVAVVSVAAAVLVHGAKKEVEKERDEVRRALEAETAAKREARAALDAEQQAKREAQSAIDDYVDLVSEEEKQKLFNKHPGDARFQSALAAAIENVGRATARLGRHDEALGLFRRAMDLQRKAMEAEPDQPRFRELMGTHAIDVAAEYAALQRPLEALDVLRAALAEGFLDRGKLKKEPLLAPLRTEPKFEKLLME